MVRGLPETLRGRLEAAGHAGNHAEGARLAATAADLSALSAQHYAVCQKALAHTHTHTHTYTRSRAQG
jgi:hypothetical protein